MKAKRRRSRKARDKDKSIDWSKAKRVRLPNLKPSTQSISLKKLRRKLAALDLNEKDIASAIAWARKPVSKIRG